VTSPAVGTNNGALVDANDAIRAENLAKTGSLSGTTPALIDYWTSPVTIEIDCVDNSAAANLCGAEPCYGRDVLPVVRVASTVAYQDIGFLGFLQIGNFSYSGQHEELNFGE
jgi:hypothetical protein